MSKHVWRFLVTAGAAVVAAVPLILADPNAEHYITNHPWVAAYIPVATAFIRTLWKAWTETASAPDIVKTP